MNGELRIEGFGTIKLLKGMPVDLSAYKLPEAQAYHAYGPWGLICLQIIETQSYLLRHFLFSLQKSISFYSKAQNSTLESLLSLNGRFEHALTGQSPIPLNDNEFLLFDAAGSETITTVYNGRLYSLLDTQYAYELYKQFLPLFQNLKKDLKRAHSKPYYFAQQPNIARHTVHDAIKAIWRDRYITSLATKHIELRLESSLFTLLAQSYNQNSREPITQPEREKAAAAREIILRDITEHRTPDQIAFELYCSAAWLKKAFGKVYGIGMFHFLRKTRMERAKEMLLRGESLKAVALNVGMKPSNFPKEFKTFFGYTVTALKKGQI